MSLKAAVSVGVTTIMLCACSDNRPDLQAFVAEVRSRPSPPVERIVRTHVKAPVVAVPKTRRSPFAPPLQTHEPQSVATNVPRPDLERPPQPLEAFALDTLKMVGSMTVGGTRYALVRAPDAVVYRVRIGDYAGKHFGKITAISHQGVAVTEIVAAGAGGYGSPQIHMVLPR